MRRAHEVDPAGVDDDEARALAQPPLHARCEDRMPVRGIRADHHDHVRVGDGCEILRSGGGAERGLEAVAVGEWQTRAQVSTLLLPKPARTSFWTRKVSSLVQRDEVMPPMALRPYRAWMRLNSSAA
jgi:hypothetical protein